jgi:hypothetical protein
MVSSSSNQHPTNCPPRTSYATQTLRPSRTSSRSIEPHRRHAWSSSLVEAEASAAPKRVLAASPRGAAWADAPSEALNEPLKAPYEALLCRRCLARVARV